MSEENASQRTDSCDASPSSFTRSLVPNLLEVNFKAGKCTACSASELFPSLVCH